MITHWQTGSISIIPSFGNPPWIPKNAGPSPDELDRADHARKVRIVVIDDEAVIAETVVEILKHEGFEAVAASTGSDAIELARTWLPDIVLSDVIMPGLNGIETGIKIRELAPKCKIILFSGQAATVNLLEQARDEGHHFEILAKPIRPEQLVSIIRATSGHSS